MPDAAASTLHDAVRRLWPELDWIQNKDLRERVARPWERAFELSPLAPDDLSRIPFTLLVPNCPATFMDHKRCVVHDGGFGRAFHQVALGGMGGDDVADRVGHAAFHRQRHAGERMP